MRGHYRILLGMAAGVGKTYRMLQEGRAAHADGRDVVIGYLEPHDRPETTALADGLEQVPRLRSTHGGLELEEMDVDAVIRRAPELALIDELAHTNAPEARNEKRWQDIDEVLVAGIDVISTVNIQHLESLNDAIAELTEVRVRETFPDQVLEDADEVVLVDLTPEALQERLRAGKVYSPDRAESPSTTSSGPTASRRYGSSHCVRSRKVWERGGRLSCSTRSATGGGGTRARIGDAGASLPADPAAGVALGRTVGRPARCALGTDARPRADGGRAGAARCVAPARGRPRRALSRRGRRQSRRHGSARRRGTGLDLCAGRDAERKPAPGDPARLARLRPRPGAAGDRHPRDREPRRPRRTTASQSLPWLSCSSSWAPAWSVALADHAHGTKAKGASSSRSRARSSRRC